MNLKTEEIIAIGDNINDKEMIENAIIGVVTGNSSEFMKKIADDVVATNDENGVAEAIRKYME